MCTPPNLHMQNFEKPKSLKKTFKWFEAFQKWMNLFQASRISKKRNRKVPLSNLSGHEKLETMRN